MLQKLRSNNLPCFDIQTAIAPAFRSLTALLLICGSAIPAAAQLTVQSVLRDFVDEIHPKHADVVEAIGKFRLRDYDGARELLDSAREQDATLPPVGVLLARMEWQIGRHESALRLLDKVVAEFPTEPEPYVAFGEHALSLGHTTEADLLFRKALVQIGSFKQGEVRGRKMAARAQAGLAAVAQHRQDWPLVAKRSEAWIQVDPTSAVAYERLGEAEYRQGRTQESLAAMQKAADIDESMPSAEATLAIMLQQDGKPEEASRYVDQLLLKNVEQLATARVVGQWLIDAQRFNDALPYLEKGSVAFPDSVELHVLCGTAATLLGKSKSARSHLHEALRLEPKSFGALNQLTLLLLEQSERTDRLQAVEHAEISHLLYPRNAEAGVTLGWAYHQVGRLVESQAVLTAAMQSGPLSPDASYFVARVFHDLGRDKDASQLLEGALQSPSLFVHRNDAHKLLDQIQGKGPAPSRSP